MANPWVEQEEDILLEGKKESLSNREISDLLEETFGDTYRTYNDNNVRMHWQSAMIRKDPDLKQFSVKKGIKKGNTQKRWSAEEDKLLETLYLDGMSVSDIAISLKEEFPNKRRWSAAICDGRVMRLNLANRTKTPRANTIMDITVLQSRCHPRLKILEAVNGWNITVECQDCKAQFRKITNKLHQICAYCENSPDTPQDLYLIEFPDFDYPSVKVGISRDFYGLRSTQFPPHKPVLVKHTIFKYAGSIEKIIKDEFKKYKTDPYELRGNGEGGTECFDISVTEKIKNRIEELHD